MYVALGKKYSLISIRQNYNFDMLATIWHEIVSWFLTISQDLRNMITKLFLFWFSYQCRTILWSQQTRTGKKPEINKQCHVKLWLKYRNDRSVSWRLSCTTVQQKESRWHMLKARPTITTYKTKSLIEGGFPAVKFHLEGWIYCYQSTPML